ncbi:MAG TPA: hypothetical protein VGZ23_02920 [bacterium]|nr:hypothetical protein [bacterium]
MYEGARNLLVAWTLLCAFGLIDGLLKILDKLPMTAAQVAVMKAITVGYWLTVWVYPTAGLAIIAVIVRPRAKQLS